MFYCIQCPAPAETFQKIGTVHVSGHAYLFHWWPVTRAVVIRRPDNTWWIQPNGDVIESLISILECDRAAIHIRSFKVYEDGRDITTPNDRFEFSSCEWSDYGVDNLSCVLHVSWSWARSPQPKPLKKWNAHTPLLHTASPMDFYSNPIPAPHTVPECIGRLDTPIGRISIHWLEDTYQVVCRTESGHWYIQPDANVVTSISAILNCHESDIHMRDLFLFHNNRGVEAYPGMTEGFYACHWSDYASIQRTIECAIGYHSWNRKTII